MRPVSSVTITPSPSASRVSRAPSSIRASVARARSSSSARNTVQNTASTPKTACGRGCNSTCTVPSALSQQKESARPERKTLPSAGLNSVETLRSRSKRRSPERAARAFRFRNSNLPERSTTPARPGSSSQSAEKRRRALEPVRCRRTMPPSSSEVSRKKRANHQPASAGGSAAEMVPAQTVPGINGSSESPERGLASDCNPN